VIADLEKLGALEKVEDFPHSVASCDRCGTFIEPLISEQWFMDMDELRKPATDVVRDGRVKFTPERWGRVYIDWMDNLRPWCISRQLWWGHQLPVWYCEADDCGEVIVEEEAPRACPACGGTALRRDTDVLDTWFSSALWPFATWGWPDETPDLAYFYPTNVLSTAREIIFLWVARMVMMGLEFVGEIPFTDVYIHSVIQAADGRRMSKSLGTGIDPLDMIDKYGADATRFGLLMMSSTQDVRFSEEKIAMGRSFANKLWNASRLVLLASEGCAAARGGAHQVDRWIASRFGRCVEAVEAAVAVYDFAAAADTLYHFVWDEFCDWYLELAKVRLYSDDEAERREAAGHARWILDQIVSLLHPFLPYVTDEVAAQYGAAPLLAQAHPRPEDFATAEADEAAVADLQALVNALRAFRAEGGVAPGQVLNAVFVGEGAAAAARYEPFAAVVRALARTEVRFAGAPEAGATVVLVPGGRLEVTSAVDRGEEIARLEGQLTKVEAEVARCEAKLGNETFVGRAPDAIVAREREKLAGYLADRDELAARVAALRSG
jgi:valyl-tRNA synthetase